MAGFPQPQHFIAAGCLFIQFWWPLYSVSSETLRFDRYRDRDLSRLQNFKDVETETQRDSRIWRMSRPRLIETKNFRGCRDRDSSRLKNLEDVETETDRDSPKGVETETESLATHWLQWKNETLLSSFKAIKAPVWFKLLLTGLKKHPVERVIGTATY